MNEKLAEIDKVLETALQSFAELTDVPEAERGSFVDGIRGSRNVLALLRKPEEPTPPRRNRPSETKE